MPNPKDNPRIIVNAVLPGTSSATAGNYGKFFTANKKCVVKSITEVHTTAGSDSGTVTLYVERLQGTETSGNGDSLMTAVSLKADAETVQTATLTSTVANLILSSGDRLNLVDSGTLTSVAGVCVSVELEIVD